MVLSRPADSILHRAPALTLPLCLTCARARGVHRSWPTRTQSVAGSGRATTRISPPGRFPLPPMPPLFSIFDRRKSETCHPVSLNIGSRSTMRARGVEQPSSTPELRGRSLTGGVTQQWHGGEVLTLKKQFEPDKFTPNVARCAVNFLGR
jgi:hypothetical protein